MEKYIAPEMEIVEFDSEDIIVTSPGGNTEVIPGGNPGDQDKPQPGEGGFIWVD